MKPELHIHIHPQTEGSFDIAERFPYEAGQSILAQNPEMIIISLGDAEDTSSVQEWFLNEHDDVASFYIVDEDLPAAPSDAED